MIPQMMIDKPLAYPVALTNPQLSEYVVVDIIPNIPANKLANPLPMITLCGSYGVPTVSQTSLLSPKASQTIPIKAILANNVVALIAGATRVGTNACPTSALIPYINP